jgi:predicted acetyltransferase
MSRIEIRPALASDEACIDNLMQLYAYDASGWYPIELQANGRFTLRPVARFWTEANQHPFLIFVDGKLAGFAVVDGEVVDPSSKWNMGYFFIARRYRGQGVGRHTAQQLFAQFRGDWEIYQVIQNTNATHFWRSVISAFTNARFTERELAIGGDHCIQQRFASKPGGRV